MATENYTITRTEPTFISNAHQTGRTHTTSRPPPSLASTPSASDESLLSLDIENIRYRRPNMFARFMAKYPYVIGLIAFLIGVTSILVSALIIPFPDFGDPTKGFNTHGTELNSRRSGLGSFMAAADHINSTIRLESNEPSPFGRRRRSMNKSMLTHKVTDSTSNKVDCATQTIDTGNFKIVFESTSLNGDLFNLHSFQSICDIEAAVLREHLDVAYTPPCHYMSSLPLFTTVLMGKHCGALTEHDVTSMKDRLAKCYPFFKNNTLKDLCSNGGCQVPAECITYDIPYKIFNYLVDINFDPSQNTKLTYTMLVYNTELDNPVEYYRETFADKVISHGSVKVTSVFESGNTRFVLFEDYFLSDMWIYIVGVALSSILLILLFYLWSVVLLIATALTVIFSFAHAYVIYYYVFQIKLFPFINILAALILIAVGADDVFIFYDAWKHAKKDDANIPLENRVARAFNHAAMSIMVTSLTTAGSFFANFVTDIVSIKCFAIFAGLAVMSNFVFMITWIPSVIIMQTKTVAFFSGFFKIPSSPKWYANLMEQRFKFSNFMFGRVIPKVIETCWHVCMLVFLGIGIAGMLIVFYKPKLKVPTSEGFPLFPRSQYMEKWQIGIKDEFQYVRKQHHWKLPVWLVWGIHPEDNGVWYDSSDLGTFKYDTSFDILSPEAQLWLTKISNVSMHDSTFVHVPIGFDSVFKGFEYLLQGCNSNIDISRKCCTNETTVPFSRAYMDICFHELWSLARKWPYSSKVVTKLPMSVAFDKQNKTKAMFLNLGTSHVFSASFQGMDDIYQNVSRFFDSQLASAPVGLRGGFWISIDPGDLSGFPPFGFYDLQLTLASGTHISIMLSLGVAAGLMFLTSLNLLLTVYAMITITLAISVTIGSLVLLGWHLNIVESITISLAVGMSIDFTIHYGMSYRMSREHYSALRTQESFSRVGSAVVMAAVTTFVSGAAMMPAHILAYTELGTFLMLVMAISWLYATFFFQSLCYIIGPRGKFCQISLPCEKKSDQDYDIPPSLQLQDPTMTMDPLTQEIYDDDTFLLPT